MAAPVLLYVTGNSTITLNRSPSVWIVSVPSIDSARLWAMESPSPFPSVCREASPRMKRSVSSVPSRFSAYFEVLRKMIRRVSVSQ